MRPGAGLNRTTGDAAGSTLALALLVCGCVFTALAGPALSLHTRTEALHQTLAGLTATTKTVQASGSWDEFTSPAGNFLGTQRDMTASEFTTTTREMGRGLSVLPLTLAAGAWAGLTTNLFGVTSGAAASAQAEAPPKLEVVYRDTLTSNTRVVAGTYAGTGAPTGALAVSVTAQIAGRFGVHPGSRMQVQTVLGPVTLFVTAILAERAPASTFWAQDIIAGTPELNEPAGGKAYWVAGVIADPDQLATMQDIFGGAGLEVNWEFPLAVGGVNADAAQGLFGALNRATTSAPTLTGTLQPAADTLTVTSPLIADLSLFLDTQAGIETVLLLLFVSLIVTGAAVILIAARMMVARREPELAMLRARGGSLGQVAAVMVGGAALAALPAAVAGAALASAVIPGGAVSSAAGWWLAGVAVAAALAGPPLIAAWQHRRPAPAANPAQITTADTGRRPRTAWRRPVAELTGCAAAAAGLIVLHDQGVPAGGGIDLYLTITPVLVAIPVVIIMLRLYPLAVHGLLRLSARGTGATGFVAMSRAARSSLTGVLPAFALVLALSLATFAGMTSNGITRGEIAASWHTTGADVLIDAGPAAGPVSTAAVQAIVGVRGVRHATAVWLTTWVTPFGQPVTVIAVDPPAYAALVADTPFPAFPAGRDRPRIGPHPVRRHHRPRARLAGRRRRPGHRAHPAELAVPDGAVHGAGRGHPERHPGRAGRRVVRDHAAGDPARPDRPARAQRGPGHRLGHRRRPAFRRRQQGDPRLPGHLPQRGARLAGQLAAPARRRAHRRADHRRGRRVRPVHRDPRPGARVRGARADPGQAHRHGPRAGHRAGHGRGHARRAGRRRGRRRVRACCCPA